MKHTKHTKVASLLCMIASGLLLSNAAVAGDSVTLTETQKDEVKCGKVYKDPDTGEKMQDCYQNTTGTYSATIKLSQVTMGAAGIVFADLTKDDNLSLSTGTFTTSAIIGSVKNKITRTAVQATLIDNHEVCAKTNVDGDCVKYKAITDGTYKFEIKPKNATITLTGKLSSDGVGKQVFIPACMANGSGIIDGDVSINIGYAASEVTLPVQVNCKVKQTTSDPNGLKGGPYELSNVTVKAKLR